VQLKCYIIVTESLQSRRLAPRGLKTTVENHQELVSNPMVNTHVGRLGYKSHVSRIPSSTNHKADLLLAQLMEFEVALKIIANAKTARMNIIERLR
jgi:hypothetical protein